MTTSGGVDPSAVRLLPWRIPDWLIDSMLVAFLAVGILARHVGGEGGGSGATEWMALAVAAVLIPARRWYPVQTLVLAIIASTVMVAVTDRPTPLFVVVLIALFNVVQRYGRRTAVVAGAITTAYFLLTVTAVLGEIPLGGAGLASIAWPAFAATAGTAVRSTRDSIVAAQERALRAEKSREGEVQRRVAEERLRIARDVHDLVAHHIAVINVQAAVAGHLMQSDVSAATAALDVVRGAAATVVDELGGILAVLRSADEVDQPTAPTPDLAAIDGLISSFAASGLVVRHETSGPPRSLSAFAELTAHRVVQEALTNAHKHGDGTATVSLRYDDGGLEVTVVNPVGPPAGDTDAHRDGYGLVGMRERVEASGGTLSAATSHAGRQFEIVATIPVKGHE
ncbi:two-component sensor histidine kinase [Aeromicrobium sp. A1-2]|uniref:sensor histidine kinase n=1 Tax=Aeromicrobium sp. A1-2 TaxID=2107713 RepID=UPI000E52975A|nr:histidine kinase [Aeromicrobium sp. A1-2]AXT86554.1 two-component sensor histidine kinase [Aeromicrobium sp. A1-2]